LTRTSAKKDSSFDHQLKRLEEIVETLEHGGVPLEKAIEMYEEGVEISKQCLEKLNQSELKLKRLTKSIDGNFELFVEDTER